MNVGAILRARAERLLEESLRSGPCACGRMKRADVSPCGAVAVSVDLGVGDPGAAGIRAEVPTACNRCGHRAKKTAMVPLSETLADAVLAEGGVASVTGAP